MEAASRRAATAIDPRLLSRVAKGDFDAFSELYDQSSRLLFTLALRILGNHEEAAQLLQDVYLEVWRKVARYDVGRGTPVAWLVTLTRSRAIERSRAGGLPPVGSAGRPEHSGPADVAYRAAGPQEQAHSELRDILTKAMGELPAAQREVVEMAYYQGLSHTEIAAQSQQPLGTVKTRMKLAMGKLRALLHSALEANASR
jgi:RNA polymerase sigma-70 factor (ECF subfamily)